MDAYTRSTQLPPNAYQLGQNVIIPDNFEVRTRPGADAMVAHTFSGKIQGVFYFDAPSIEQIIFASAGVMYVASSTGVYAQVPGFTLSDGDVDFIAAQGVNKMLVVDGTSAAIWDGAALQWTTFTGLNATDPPFTATTLVFCAGRMWAAGFPGTGPEGKEEDAVCFSSILSFGAGQWSLTDKSFRVGGGEGDPVIGLVKLPASVPEQEVLGVLKQDSIHIIRVDPTLDVTAFQDSLVSETVSSGLGVVGKKAFTVFGNDLLYVAPDRSFRSLERMQAATAQYQVAAPLSLPLQPYIDRINWNAASTISVVRYKQLALFAVPLDTATSSNTVFVWNGRLQKWVGIFTGWTPNSFTVTRFNGVQALVFGDSAGSVKKWKDALDPSDDATYLDDGAAIADQKLWTRAFLFQEPLNDKDAYYAEARFSQSNAIVNFTLTGDNEDLESWTKDLRPVGPNLPIDLPFELTSAQNTPARKGLRGLPTFNECYLKLETDEGWFSVRNVSMAAFLNTLSTTNR